MKAATWEWVSMLGSWKAAMARVSLASLAAIRAWAAARSITAMTLPSGGATTLRTGESPLPSNAFDTRAPIFCKLLKPGLTLAPPEEVRPVPVRVLKMVRALESAKVWAEVWK